MKQLLFPYSPKPGESLIGAFAEALHDHRIRSIRTGIEGGGFSLARPGSLQMASDDQIASIASVMRSDTAKLKAAAFRPTVARDRIALGDLELPRAIFDLERRWIGPCELLEGGFHRADWLNLLLPYCPRSLEQLVDRCPVCGPLAWRITRGVANCDQCGEAIPPSSAPGLEPELTGPYRFAADLMSLSGDVGAAAASRLPETIQPFSRSALCDLIIRAGVVFGTQRDGHALVDLTAKPAAELAAVVATGVRLIAGWPRSVREAVGTRTEEMGSDLAAYDRLRVDLRWMTQGSDEARQMIAIAFPTLDGRTAKPFAGDRRYYTATQTNMKLWTNSSELEALRDAKALAVEKLPSKVRIRARYDADDVDALRVALDRGVRPGSAASELDVPIYALGQFVDAGRLELCDAPGVRILRGVQILKYSVAALKAELQGSISGREPSATCVPVRRLVAAYPGEKPWGECVELLIKRKVMLYATEAAFSIRDLLFEPSDIPALRCADEAVGRDPTGIERLPLRDAYEVLGAPEEEAIAAIRSSGLEIISEGRGKSVCRGDLRRLFSKIAFTGEVALHEGSSPISTFHRLSRLKIPRVHGAWSRSALLERGMVKPLPRNSGHPASTYSFDEGSASFR